MKNLFYSSKRFLNMEGFEEDASIFAEIKFHSSEGKYVATTLKLRDCSNRVDFTINISAGVGRDEGPDQFDNSIFKIQTLIDELSKFKQACIEAHEESERRYIKEKEQDEMDSRNSNTDIVYHLSDPASTPVVGSGNLR